MLKVDVFHIGPQKAGTTWVYECLKGHPQLCAGKKHSIHYFDINYHKGEEWYLSNFEQNNLEKKTIDITPTYIRCPYAAERIFNYNPQAKLILCLRNPIERAFSHYWHNKKKSEYLVPFSRFKKNYDLYNSWIETGFYFSHLSRFLKFFPRNQILVQDFDHLEMEPLVFLKQVYQFLDIDECYKPDALEKRINVAKPQKSIGQQKLENFFMQLRLMHLFSKAEKIFVNTRILDQKLETLGNVSQDLIEELSAVYKEEIENLESLLDRDFSHWIKNK